MNSETRFRNRALRAYIELCYEHGKPVGKWGETWSEGDNYSRPDGDILTTPYALVETSRYGQVWITLHASPDAAAEAHVRQEYVEDWEVHICTGLILGDAYSIEYKPIVRKVR